MGKQFVAEAKREALRKNVTAMLWRRHLEENANCSKKKPVKNAWTVF